MGLATRGNTQVSVSFSAPSNDGGSAITNYTVTSSPGGFNASSASSPIIVTGLANGTAYTFTVKAININGIGMASLPSNSITPATTPGVPTNISAISGNRQASVMFLVPAFNGGSEITNYTVTSSPGGFVGISDSSPIAVTGLTNGTAYVFTVTATNDVGSGASSVNSGSVLPGVVRNAGFDSTGYQALQDAYNADTHTSEIQIVAGAQVGPFVKSESDTVTVKGGFDDTFSSSSDVVPSTLGVVTLKNGVTRFQNVVIRP
jgi:hypothetical protein